MGEIPVRGAAFYRPAELVLVFLAALRICFLLGPRKFRCRHRPTRIPLEMAAATPLFTFGMFADVQHGNKPHNLVAGRYFRSVLGSTIIFGKTGFHAFPYSFLHGVNDNSQ